MSVALCTYRHLYAQAPAHMTPLYMGICESCTQETVHMGNSTQAPIHMGFCAHGHLSYHTGNYAHNQVPRKPEESHKYLSYAPKQAISVFFKHSTLAETLGPGTQITNLPHFDVLFWCLKKPKVGKMFAPTLREALMVSKMRPLTGEASRDALY